MDKTAGYAIRGRIDRGCLVHWLPYMFFSRGALSRSATFKRVEVEPSDCLTYMNHRGR